MDREPTWRGFGREGLQGRKVSTNSTIMLRHCRFGQPCKAVDVASLLVAKRLVLARPRHVDPTSCGGLSCLWPQGWFLEVRHQHASSRSRFADAYYVRGRKWVRSGRVVEISKIEDAIVWSLTDFTAACCAF